MSELPKQIRGGEAVTKICVLLTCMVLVGTGIGGGFLSLVSASQSELGGVMTLPQPTYGGTMSVEEALLARRSIRSFQDQTLPLEQLAQLLWAAQGITEERRGYRTAPSAGALYPLEVYVVVGQVDEVEAGVYRYQPQRHELVQVGLGDVRSDLARAALGQRMIAESAVVVVFTAVYPRTTRRYGERGIRYVHMEAGHAAQNLSLQAVSLGLGTVVVGAFDDDNVSRLLSLPADEAPLYLLPVGVPR